jgi:hypothetical protein
MPCWLGGRFWQTCALGHVLVQRRPTLYHLAVSAFFERLGPGYWWSDPTTAWDGNAVLVFAVALAFVFIGAATAWALADRIAATDAQIGLAVRRRAAWGCGLASSGLLLILFRWQMTPFFGRRIWFILWVITVVIMVVSTAMRRSQAAGTTRNRSLPNV